MIQNKQAIYLFTLSHYKKTLAKQNKNYSHISNCEEEELPKKPVGQQTANSQPTDGQQTANSRLTGFLASSSSQLPRKTITLCTWQRNLISPCYFPKFNNVKLKKLLLH